MDASTAPKPPVGTLNGEPLSAHTSLELGGPARWFHTATDRTELLEVIRWARSTTTSLYILGGGSNLVIADKGIDGMVLEMGQRGTIVDREVDEVIVTAAAGEPWDEMVEWAVAEGWAGLECLAGIPGSVGAVPIQNVGAYGQEVADVIHRVEVADRMTGEVGWLSPGDCGFGYRSSRFRRHPDRYVVLAVAFHLRPGGRPTIRYSELERRLAAGEASPDLSAVRDAVLDLRRSKSMVLAPEDPNRRSVGSFFVNPTVEPDEADRLARRTRALGLIDTLDEMPRFPCPDGTVKLPAAWLIEHAGFARGLRRGAVGISSAHTLALVHHGGGTTRELLALADEICQGVADRFGLSLRLEPVVWGTEGQSAL